MSDGSLSEREQRILEEIEKNLLETDPALVKRVGQKSPRKDSVRMLRAGIFAMILGFAGLVGFLWHWLVGLAGFVLMLAGVVAVAVAVRSMSAGGRAAGAFREAWKRAEDRMRGNRGES